MKFSMDNLPVPIAEVKEVIAALIKKDGLETLTSSKIRAHLKERFDKDFTESKKAVDDLTKKIIEEQQNADVSDSDSDLDIAPPPKEPTPEITQDDETSDSDDGVISTDRARPVKKNLKRKASNENLDLMSSVKTGRRDAARKAADKITKAAGWKTKLKEKTGKDKGKITKGTRLVYISEELQEITKQKFMRRCDVVKAMWVYVRENNRIDPKDKRYAIVEGDPAMEKIFKGKKRIQMFGVMGSLGHRHLMNPENVSLELVEECEQFREKLIAEWNANQLLEDSNESDNDNSKDTPVDDESRAEEENHEGVSTETV